MKHLVTCVSVVFTLCHSASGQPWAPYVPGQVSSFKVDGLFYNYYSIRQIDTAYPTPSGFQYFFGNGGKLLCDRRLVSSTYQIFDYLECDSSKCVYYFPGNPPNQHDSMVIVASADSGESWLTRHPFDNFPSDTFLITCTGKYFENVLDTLWDSIKTFQIQLYSNNTVISHPKDPIEFTISKNHGFTGGALPMPFEFQEYSSNISSWPYNETIYGLKTSVGEYGQFPPGTLDFFPYTPGTVLKWRRNFRYYDVPNNVIVDDFNIRDSIVEVIKGPSTVHLKFDRTIQKLSSPQIEYKPGTTISIPIDGLQPIIEGHSFRMNYGSVPLLENVSGSTSRSGWSTSPFTRYTNSWGIDVTFGGASLEQTSSSSNCRLFQFSDMGVHLSLSSRFGITSIYETFHYGYDNWNLTGFQSDNDSFGNTYPLGTPPSVVPRLFVSVFPNPASDFIIIELPMHENTTSIIRIISLQGAIVYSSNITNGNHVPISHLPAGPYIVEVILRDETARAKLIKQ